MLHDPSTLQVIEYRSATGAISWDYGQSFIRMFDGSLQVTQYSKSVISSAKENSQGIQDCGAIWVISINCCESCFDVSNGRLEVGQCPKPAILGMKELA